MNKEQQKELIVEIMNDDQKDGLYNNMTAVEWLYDYMVKNQYFIGNDLLQAIEQAKEMEKEQKNNLPIVIHEGIENTWVYIEDGIVHVKPNPKANEHE